MECTMAELAQDQERKNSQQKALPILFAMLLSGFIGLFNETALNVALTPLMELLEVEAATIQWLTTAYLLTLGVLVPISGLLLQWITTRKLFALSLLFSIGGTLIGALAPSFEVLLVGRIFQAVGTGLLLPLMINTMLIIFPIEKRGSAMGLIGLVIMFAPAIGPSIAGLILSNLSWHWIFWITLPFYFLSIICGLLFLPNITKLTRPKIDILSIFLSTVGFGGIVYGFSSAGGHGESGSGWSSPVVVLTVVIGAVSLLFFSIRQLRMKEPVMDLRAFKYPMFSIGLIVILLASLMMMSSLLILPMFLQKGLAVSALTAGLVVLPGSLLNGLLSPLTGRLFDKYGPKWLVRIGFIVVGVVLFIYTTVDTTTPLGTFIFLHLFMMIGIAMIMMPAQTNGINQLPPEYYPHGTAIMNTLQQIAAAIGTAVAVSILSAGQNSFLRGVANPDSAENKLAGFTTGVQYTFIFALALSLIGLVISFFIKRVRVSGIKNQQGPMH